MPFQIHLSCADPSEAGVDQCTHLMGRGQLAGFQEMGEFACALLDRHQRTSLALTYRHARAGASERIPGRLRCEFQIAEIGS
jgi:hypothetical protein